jgi:hypothetical protein
MRPSVAQEDQGGAGAIVASKFPFVQQAAPTVAVANDAEQA